MAAPWEALTLIRVLARVERRANALSIASSSSESAAAWDLVAYYRSDASRGVLSDARPAGVDLARKKKDAS
jgi:hypothetical protein